jgi:hypothetical protein
VEEVVSQTMEARFPLEFAEVEEGLPAGAG